MESSLTELKTFLSKHHSENAEDTTHLSYGLVQGKFKLDKGEREEFMKLYYRAVKNGNKLSIIEKPIEYSPLVVDIDLEVENLCNGRLYDDKMIYKFVKIYTKQLNKIIDEDSRIYDFYIFEKSQPTIKNNTSSKDGFHIWSPICLDFNEKFYLREKVISKLEKEGIFNNFKYPLDKIVDKAVIKSNGWFLYGSSKPERINDPYKVTKCISYNNGKFETEEYKKDIDIKKAIQLFSILTYTKKDKTETKIIKKETKATKEIKETDEIKEQYNKITEEGLTDLVYHLSDDRADDYESWILAGVALKDYSYKTHSDLFNIWNLFSLKSEKYKQTGKEGCLKKWNSFTQRDEGVTIATLIKWLKEDAPEYYDEWNKKYNKNDDQFYEDMFYYSDFDFAKTFYENNKNYYCYSRISQWYEYNKFNRLVHCEKIPESLKHSMTEYLRNFIIDKRNNLKPPEKKKEKEIYITRVNFLNNLYKSVAKSSFVRGIIEYLPSLYTVEDLDDKIDNNINLLAFNDCVFDYSIKNFRPIKTTDYLMKTVKYNRPEPNQKVREDILRIIRTIFENDEIEKYYLESTAMALFNNTFEVMYIHTGSGGNGKGLLTTLITSTLGEYFKMAPSTFLTESNSRVNYNNTLVESRGIRYLLVTEPESKNNNSDIILNTEFVKKITGNDIIETRQSYSKKNTTISPQFTLFLQCNKKPSIDDAENLPALTRRIEKGLINFPFTFTNIKEKKDNKRPLDVTLKTKLKTDEYRNEFILLLLDTAKNIKLENNIIKVPRQIIEDANKYLGDNDPVKKAIDEGIIIKSDKGRVKLSVLVDTLNRITNKNYLSKTIKSFMINNNFGDTCISGGYQIYKGIDLKIDEEKEQEKEDIFLS
jgi:hypothetical protein